MWYDEMLTAEIGQVGTQYDGLGAFRSGRSATKQKCGFTMVSPFRKCRVRMVW